MAERVADAIIANLAMILGPRGRESLPGFGLPVGGVSLERLLRGRQLVDRIKAAVATYEPRVYLRRIDARHDDRAGRIHVELDLRLRPRPGQPDDDDASLLLDAFVGSDRPADITPRPDPTDRA